MNNTKCLQVAQRMIDSAMEVNDAFFGSLVDALDSYPGGDDDHAVFEMMKYIDEDDGNAIPQRIARRKPLGKIVYTITVEGKYEAYDE